MQPENDAMDADGRTLREQAIARAENLLKQLSSDHDGLLQCAKRGNSIQTQTGAAAVAEVMEAARRVRDRLHGS